MRDNRIIIKTSELPSGGVFYNFREIKLSPAPEREVETIPHPQPVLPEVNPLPEILPEEWRIEKLPSVLPNPKALITR